MVIIATLIIVMVFLSRSERLPCLLCPQIAPPNPVFAFEYPWMVGVGIEGKARRCGGVLISPSYVLTAAHCIDKNLSSHLRPFDPFPVEKIKLFWATQVFGTRPIDVDLDWKPVPHPLFKSRGVPIATYDVAIIRLAAPVEGEVTTAPVGVGYFLEGDAIVSGWGHSRNNSSKLLRAAIVPIQSDFKVCREQLDKLTMSWVDKHSLCTVHNENAACRNDSGGPLVVGTREEPQTVGIVSWGSNKSCGVPLPGKKLVGVYARTSLIAEWIQEVTNDEATVTKSAPGPLMPLSLMNE